MKRFISLFLLAFVAYFAQAQIPIVDNFKDLLKVPDGDTIQLKPGSYSGSIVLKERYSSETVFILNSVQIDAADQRFAIDMQGKNITFLMKDSKITGGKDAGIGHRGNYCKIIAENTLVTDNNFGLRLVGTNHHIEGLTFRGQKSTGITGNNKKLNQTNREVAFGFHYGPVNNWRITRCNFFDIFPPVPGDAGGAIRIIPYAHTVTIDNCYFNNIGGSVVWFDHCQKKAEIYYNVFENIKNETGKCVFLEIFDPRPDETSGFVARVAGNVFRDVEKQTILVAASSGQKPGGIEIWGNTIESGWGIIAGAMERRFARRFEKDKPGDWQWVNARLENISIHHNVIQPTTGRNHGAFYKGQFGGNNIVWNNNWYVTGHQYRWEKPNGLIDEGTINEGKIYQGGDKMNPHGFPIQKVSFYDKNAVEATLPDSFPWPEVFAGIPVQNYARSDIDVPDIPDTTDSTKTDPPKDTTTIPSRDLKRVWITSDLSTEKTDPDDKCWAAYNLLFLNEFDLQGYTVGAHKWKLPNALDWFNSNIGIAYAKERDNLSKLGGDWPETLPMYQASTTGKGYQEGIEDLSKWPSVFALYKAAKAGKLYILNGGPMGEIATMVDYCLRKDPATLLNIVIISHATAPENQNNCVRDKNACAFLHQLAAEGKIKFIEVGKSGQILIDTKTFPKISNSILDSEIASFFQEKWQHQKPDFSDGMTTYFIVEGLVDEYEEKYADGRNNVDRIVQQLSGMKDKLYERIEYRSGVAAGDTTPEPDQGGEEPEQEEPGGSNEIDLEKIELKLKSIKSYIEEILREIELGKSSSSGSSSVIDRIEYEGTAQSNVIIKNQNPGKREVLDFEKYDFNGYNLQIVNSSNLAILNPNIVLNDFENNCIKVDNSKDIFLYKPKTKRGSNGIKFTNYSSNNLVYKGEVDSARIDGYTCHKADYPCGDANIFYDCKGLGGEQSFDITSGDDHLIASSSGSGISGIALSIGHGASCNVVDFSSPLEVLSIKETSYVNLSDVDVAGIVMRKQGSNGNLPKNISLYGLEPQVKNSTGLPLRDIYSRKAGNFSNPVQDRLESNLAWINKNL